MVSNANAPSPYTVSVGNATGWRSWRSFEADFIALEVSGSDMHGESESSENVMDVGSQCRIFVQRVIVGDVGKSSHRRRLSVSSITFMAVMERGSMQADLSVE